MLFPSPADAAFAGTISRLAYCNPFLPERIEYEREALGAEFVDADVVWNVTQDWEGTRPNIASLRQRVEQVATAARDRLAEGVKPDAGELRQYEDLTVYLLYYRVQEPFHHAVHGDWAKPQQELAAAYERFCEAARHFLQIPGVRMPIGYEPEHLFALYFQVRRAFYHIFHNIVGRSMPAARLRAAIWQSIFTHDLRRYRRVLYDRMGDLTTLITGPSGTGKELVARAIAMARYIPFDAKAKVFAGDYAESFIPLNLSALSPTLIESELFGHRRGAFTGALEDRAGWLETCPPMGTVFLDEIGELDPAIQVKLLRVLQSRTFQRLGDTKNRQFRGKIIAATNRDLPKEMARGSFRTDFYYRICSDLVVTPSLAEQLVDNSRELRSLVYFIASRVIDEDEADGLADEVERWVAKHLGRDYAWPGNFRELEQCVKNIMIRHEYRPPIAVPAGDDEQLVAELRSGKITADELLRRYCTLVYMQTRNYEETARRLGLDRRTVKAKVEARGNGDGQNTS
jgi:transcriptional regulator with AAA-type ATPase domain